MAVVTSVASKATQPKILTGVVVSAGRMQKTVKVRIAAQQWNNHIRKFFPAPYTLLTHDPRSSLREGDVITLTPGHRVSRHVHHVVTSIISPFGIPVSQRPAIPTASELLAEAQAKRQSKDERQAARGRQASIRRLREQREKRHIEGSELMKVLRDLKESRRRASQNLAKMKGSKMSRVELHRNLLRQSRTRDALVKSFGQRSRPSMEILRARIRASVLRTEKRDIAEAEKAKKGSEKKARKDEVTQKGDNERPMSTVNERALENKMKAMKL